MVYIVVILYVSRTCSFSNHLGPRISSIDFMMVGPPITLGSLSHVCNIFRIIIGSDRRPETEQGIEGKIVRFSDRVRAIG